jgi:Acyl-CoA thioesterase N-terminal domain/Acyl-CoA thioesterase C-terminal domain
MPSAFEAATAVTADDAVWFADIPDGWQQGRGAFGGVVLATLLRAIERAEPDAARATRTLSGDLCGPVLPGRAAIAVRALRRGSNQSNWTAELVQEGQVLATASAVLSPRRIARSEAHLSPPAPLPPWRELAPLGLGSSFGPPFARHYDYRTAGVAFAGSGEATIDGWVREREPLARVDAPALVGRLDAWYPTLFDLDRTPRPVATISFTAEILVDPATLPPGEPLRYRARMAALHDGFFVELRELWHDGRVVALNQQTFAILK